MVSLDCSPVCGQEWTAECVFACVQMDVHTFPVSLLGYADFLKMHQSSIGSTILPHQRLLMSTDVILTRMWGHAC